MVTQAIGSFVILPMVDVDPKANCTLFHLIKVVNSDFSPRQKSFFLNYNTVEAQIFTGLKFVVFKTNKISLSFNFVIYRNILYVSSINSIYILPDNTWVKNSS